MSEKERTRDQRIDDPITVEDFAEAARAWASGDRSSWNTYAELEQETPGLGVAVTAIEDAARCFSLGMTAWVIQQKPDGYYDWVEVVKPSGRTTIVNRRSVQHVDVGQGHDPEAWQVWISYGPEGPRESVVSGLDRDVALRVARDIVDPRMQMTEISGGRLLDEKRDDDE